MTKIANAFGYDLVGFLAFGRTLLESRHFEDKIQGETLTQMGLTPLTARGIARVPVFDLARGEPAFWEEGLPIGAAEDYVYLPVHRVRENWFAVAVPDDAMAPALRRGDVAVVDPALWEPEEPGCLVFVAWPDKGAPPVVRWLANVAGEGVMVSDGPHPAAGALAEVRPGKDGSLLYEVVLTSHHERRPRPRK